MIKELLYTPLYTEKYTYYGYIIINNFNFQIFTYFNFTFSEKGKKVSLTLKEKNTISQSSYKFLTYCYCLKPIISMNIFLLFLKLAPLYLRQDRMAQHSLLSYNLLNFTELRFYYCFNFNYLCAQCWKYKKAELR